MRLAANAGPKSRQKSPSGHHPTTLSGYIFATKASIDNWKKNLLNSNTTSTCSHNMVNFNPLAAEIVSLVWGTPGNFSGFRVLAALQHGTLVVGVSQTPALNRGGHLYSAGRPSRWVLAHISSGIYVMVLWKKDAFQRIGSQVWYYQFTKGKVTQCTTIIPQMMPNGGEGNSIYRFSM